MSRCSGKKDFPKAWLRARLEVLIASGVFAIAFAAAIPARAQGDAVADLDCPTSIFHPPTVVTTPVIPGTAANDLPPLGELGNLARPVIREQPVLDISKAPGFSLQGSGPHRIAFFGDSHIAAGPFMPQLQKDIRDSGETVSQRYLPPTMGRANVRLPIRAYCIGSAWETELAFTTPSVVQTGPALANRMVTGGPGAYLWLDLRNADRLATVSRLRMIYRSTAEQADVDYTVNDEPDQHAVLTGTGSGSEELEIKGNGPISTVKLEVNSGRLVLNGFIQDYETPPQVTFDVFGIPGSTARGWIMADPTYLTNALHGIDYDGVALEYGTNEGNDTRFDRDKYTTNLTAALANMRVVFPHASCLLIGPPDRGTLARRGTAVDLLHFSRIHEEIVAVQTQVGAQFNCTEWNWQDLMGGPGGSYGWALATPRYAGHDLTHLSSAGYRLTANALANSLGWRSGPLTP